MIVLYSTSQCSKCKKVAGVLDKNGVDYKKILIDENDDAREELIMQNIFSVPAMQLADGRFVSLRNVVSNDTGVDEAQLLEMVNG
jgi:arsenate reductase-like glutaredoxin family protein